MLLLVPAFRILWVIVIGMSCAGMLEVLMIVTSGMLLDIKLKKAMLVFSACKKQKKNLLISDSSESLLQKDLTNLISTLLWGLLEVF